MNNYDNEVDICIWRLNDRKKDILLNFYFNGTKKMNSLMRESIFIRYKRHLTITIIEHRIFFNKTKINNKGK